MEAAEASDSKQEELNSATEDAKPEEVPVPDGDASDIPDAADGEVKAASGEAAEGTEATPSLSTKAAPDAVTDAAPDTALEEAPDAAPKAVPDAGPEAAPEVVAQPPGNFSATPAQAAEQKESEQKLRAVEQLKAALQKAAAMPPVRRAETVALSSFCLCLLHLSKAPDAAPELTLLYEELPRLGEDFFVPLLGIRRSKKTSAAPVGPATGEKKGQKSSGRVKSYSTKKGFGFIDMPGFGRDIFVYNSHLVGRIGLIAGEAVEFELMMDGNRPQARQVKVVSAPLNTGVEIPMGFRPLPMGGMVSGPQATGKTLMANANPLGAMKQAMAGAQGGTSMHEMALAMAAAAAEVPTTLPQNVRAAQQEAMSGDNEANSEEQLFKKIREAQTAAASDKRRPMPKVQADTMLESYVEHQQVRGNQVAASASRGGADQGADLETKFTDEGNIPRNARVRVVNFPATEVNDCIGVVQGFDAATARYSVAVDMRKGGPGGGGGETVPLQLKEEYLHVEGHGAEARPAGGTRGAASATSSQPPPQPFSGGSAQSEALRKSASEALKRFSESSQFSSAVTEGHYPSGPGQMANPAAMAAQQQQAMAMANFAAMSGMPPGGKGFGKSPFYPPNAGPGGGPSPFPGPGGPLRPHGPGATAPGGPGMPPAGSPFSSQPRPGASSGKGGDISGDFGGPHSMGPGQVRPSQPGLQSPDQFGRSAPSMMNGNVAGRGPDAQKGMQPGSYPMGGPGSGGGQPLRPPQAGPSSMFGGPGQPPAARQQQQQPRPSTAVPSQAPPQPMGLSLERAAFMTPGASRPEMRPPANAAKSGMPLSGPDGPPAKAMNDPRMQPGQAQPKASPAASKAIGPAGAVGQPTSEGRPGARWRALRSEKFSDIIVRETMEVASKTLRRIQPGEVCVQRGSTVVIETGLVRMQIEPDGGWVTVHARNIQGPTFLEEADGPSDRPASYDIRLQQQVGQRQGSPSPPPAKAAKAPPSPDHVPFSQRASPPRERPAKAPPNVPREDRKSEKGQRAPKAPPVGSAPWQDGEDPWSRTSDPWAKSGDKLAANDPWAAAAGPKKPQASRAPTSKSQPTSSGHGPGQWGKEYAASSSANAPGASYDRMDMLRIRERLLATNTMKPAPKSVEQIRTLRIPNMEVVSDRRSRRSERDRADRDRRDEQKASAAAGKDDDDRGGGGASAAFLRDRGNAAARDSPMRGEARLESHADGQQRSGQPSGAASANRGASPAAPAAAGSPTTEKRETGKSKEEQKANCPTQ